MWSFFLALFLTVAAAQEGKVFPAVKLAGAGSFGQGAGGAREAGGPGRVGEGGGEEEQVVILQKTSEEVVAKSSTTSGSQEESNGKAAEEVASSSYGILEPFNLPAGATLLLGPIDTTFSCSENPYGYYADEYNRCAVFHICLPNVYEDGAIETHQYSFMCGEDTQFDQKELACVEQSAAIRCEDSSEFYYRNEEFGLPQEKV